MRCVVQRVKSASVTVGDELVSSIGRGICVLVGIHRDDTSADSEWMAKKLLNLRIFGDKDDKRWESSVKDNNLEILCVSQFTLYAVLKGNKPDFHESMRAELSREFFDSFVEKLRLSYAPEKIKVGRFGAKMAVNITNDGPVTITLDSPKTGLPGKKDKMANSKKLTEQINDVKIDDSDLTTKS